MLKQRMTKVADKYKTGACGPAQVTTPMSWGAACPPGQCTAADLAAGLNRQFAGDAYPCRELPYWIVGDADGSGNLTLSQNAIVTICPTRILILAAADTTDDAALLEEFTIGNQNQIIGDPIPFKFLRPDSYQIIPFVTDCIKAGMPFSVRFSGVSTGGRVYFGMIGPAIG